jgi:ribose transport system permease protein
VAAVCYALAGILLAGHVQTAVPDAGNSYLLPVIAAVVVGGTPFTGGRGSVVATAVAAVFLTQLLQVVLALGAPSSTQLIVQSIAIAAATGLRYLPWARLRGPVRPQLASQGVTGLN